MPFGEPNISESANYKIMVESSLSIPDSAAYISITMAPSDEGWTQAGLDALFQQFLDYLSAAPFLAPSGGSPVMAGSKNQAVNTLVAPTPAPEE